MISDGLPQPLTTVLAGGGEQIHLASAPLPPQPGELPLTLCHKPVRDRVPAQRFHRLGCRECAAAAVHCGITFIQDLEHATVNLPRFLAGRQLAGPADR